ncbi:MAG: acyl-CoA dehydrogenase family protein [Planctomycetes bacterium]|nr:acyl-CoA dehydrogenase family protein [Planctomycetota bacterium]
MDYSFDENQIMIRDTFRGFAQSEVRKTAEHLDQNPEFPRELFKKAADLGTFGLRYPEPYGAGLDVVTWCLAIEELARESLAFAATCMMQSLMGTYFVHRFGSDDVKGRLFEPALAGEKVATICMTEPNAGSDLMSLKTRAERRDGRYFISGQKTWITSAPVADMFTVLASTGERQLAIFLVEKGASGLDVGKSIDKMGVRSSLTSEVSFDNVPATEMLGEEGRGLEYLREILAEIRVGTAALSLGIAEAALAEATRYAGERKQFGKPIGQFQAIQTYLAEMRTQLEAARHLTYFAAWRSDMGMPKDDHASMAKLFASEAALDICDKACRIFASYGFAKEYPVERYYRDARFLILGGGTSEILKVNIAKSMLRDS